MYPPASGFINDTCICMYFPVSTNAMEYCNFSAKRSFQNAAKIGYKKPEEAIDNSYSTEIHDICLPNTVTLFGYPSFYE